MYVMHDGCGRGSDYALLATLIQDSCSLNTCYVNWKSSVSSVSDFDTFKVRLTLYVSLKLI